MRIGYRLPLLLLAALLSSCSTTRHHHYAPVTDIEAIEHVPASGMHRMLAGETLYSVAWRYGLDYRHLAKLNHMSSPYGVHVGEVIYLRQNVAVRNATAPITEPASSAPMTPAMQMPVVKPVPMVKSMRVEAKPKQKFYNDLSREPIAPVRSWYWPAHGPLIGTFSSTNKGINIGGRVGTPVYATAAGKVVYSGSGLRGYGNLVIIEHNRTFLSAYAHNSTVLVSEGDWVKADQKIAEMGSSGSRSVMLHFEIRRSGLPVNPLIYLARHG